MNVNEWFNFFLGFKKHSNSILYPEIPEQEYQKLPLSPDLTYRDFRCAIVEWERLAKMQGFQMKPAGVSWITYSQFLAKFQFHDSLENRKQYLANILGEVKPNR